MANEDHLPQLKNGSSPSRTATSSETYGRLRKRARLQETRDESVLSNSSDPAIFSSDDDPSVDDYTPDRRKKRYLGSWFQRSRPVEEDEPPLPPRPRRQFIRQHDSGIYMPSDEPDSDGITPDELPLPKLRAVASPFGPCALSREADLVGRKIQACVDSGVERVDLSSIGLQSLPNNAIKPLSEFSTTIPLVAKGVPFEQRDPEIELYLSGNSLTSLPPSLFDIEYLTTLTLRNNKLTELPPAIGKLRNLRSLNIAQNHLRYLPLELLDLASDIRNTRLLHIHLHPNPFLQPLVEVVPELGLEEITVESQPLEPGDVHEKLPTTLHSAFYFARSPVQYSDVYGHIYSDFKVSDACSPVPVTDDIPKQFHGPERLGACPDSPSRAPTLLDIALRACYNSPSLPYLPDSLDGFPRLQSLVAGLMARREAGDMTCASCGRQLVTPKTMWLEWWALTKMQSRELSPQTDGAGPTGATVWRRALLNSDPEEKFVPFVRHGCSWKCLPADLAQGSWYHEC